MNKRGIRFGANYVPSKKWNYSWVDWDRESIREDLQAIQDLGMDHIRMHCMWPVFQPNARYISETATARLIEMMDLADECNLDVEVSVLDGWLCGFVNLPSWKGARNIFTDPEVVEAQELLFTTLAEKVGNHKRFMGFDLGNEINVLHSFGEAVSVEKGDIWFNRIMDVCEKIAPGKFHVNGVDHIPWFANQGFSRDLLANRGSATAVHAWIEFTGARKRYKALEAGSTHLAEYFIELAKAYSNDVNRQVWLQEFGVSKLWMTEEETLAFAEGTCRSVMTCSNLWGMTWWCAHDIDRQYAGFDPLEYGMGLIDCSNKIKPIGRKVRELIREFDQKAPEKINRTTALVLNRDLFEVKKENEHLDYPGWAFAEAYFRMVEEGIRPAVVLEDKAGDADYLQSRHIKELVRLK